MNTVKLNKIMLIFPPSSSLTSWEPMVTPPMGMAYLGAAVRKAGYEVKLLDTVCEDAYCETRLNDHICRYGLPYHHIVEKVKAFDPQVVGLSCIFSNQWPALRDIAMRLRAQLPGLIIVAGGAHPTFLPVRSMEDAPLDYIIKGEGEQSFVDLLDRLKLDKPIDQVDGLVWREGDQIRENPKTGYIKDLDSIPFPAYDLLPMEKYFKYALPMSYGFLSARNVPMVTSRGCPHKCSFCSSTNLWGNRFRMRSPENVLEEMDWLVDTYGIREIKFQDDNLTAGRDRARKIFQAMIDRPWHLHWNTPNGIATWTLDEEIISLAKRSGCYSLTMAIESGDQEVIDKIVKKPIKLENVIKVNDIMKKNRIHRSAYFIIGFPGETREQIQNTIDLGRKLKLDARAVFIYNPLPGSELFEECVRRGYVTEESFFETGNQYFSSVVDSEDWTGEELETLIRRVYFGNYLIFFKPSYSSYITARAYLNYLRHRPSFLKFAAARSLRTLELALKKTPVVPGKPEDMGPFLPT